MRELMFDIDQVVLRTGAERGQLERVSAAIRDAFRLLGERLERTPFGQSGAAQVYALELLEVSSLALDDLLAPQGAERLADELYRQLARRIQWTIP